MDFPARPPTTLDLPLRFGSNYYEKIQHILIFKSCSQIECFVILIFCRRASFFETLEKGRTFQRFLRQQQTINDQFFNFFYMFI